MAADDYVIYEVSEGIATITLNRPNEGNALTLSLMRALARTTARAQDSRAVQAIVLTGAGTDFCAGAESDAAPDRLSADEVDLLFPDPTKRYLSDISTPIICALDGACLGAGLELMLGSDLRIASERAVFGLPEVRWGQLSGGGAPALLPRQTSWSFAMELLLTGLPVSAARAYEAGLVNEVVPPSELASRARALATVVAANGPLAVQASKTIVARTQALEAALVLEASVYRRVMRSTDADEGRRARKEGRIPTFSGQ